MALDDDDIAQCQVGVLYIMMIHRRLVYNVRLRWSRFLGYVSPTHYVPAAWWKPSKQKKKNDTLSLIFDSFLKTHCVFFTIFKWWCATSREHQRSIYSLFCFTCNIYDGHSFDLSPTMTLTLRRYDVLHQQQQQGDQRHAISANKLKTCVHTRGGRLLPDKSAQHLLFTYIIIIIIPVDRERPTPSASN